MSDAIKALEGGLNSASAPTVTSVAITSATGISGNVLDLGDVVTVQVEFSRAVLVTGTPQIFVQYANTNVRSYYESGAGSDTLYFTYTVQDHGVNGAISIPENALHSASSPLPGSTITDIAGNAAILTHAAVSAISSYQVQIRSGTGPDAPSIYTIEGDNKINITEKADGVFVAGTAEANSTVDIEWGADTREVTADAGGNWSAYYGAGDSTVDVTITVTPTDEAGNVGTASTISVTVDTSAPSAPTISFGNSVTPHRTILPTPQRLPFLD